MEEEQEFEFYSEEEIKNIIKRKTRRLDNGNKNK